MNYTVDATAGRNPAATFGEADGNGPNRDPTGEECDRRVRTNSCGERARYREDARADDHAHNAGCQGPWTHRADQSGVSFVFLHVAPDPREPSYEVRLAA